MIMTRRSSQDMRICSPPLAKACCGLDHGALVYGDISDLQSCPAALRVVKDRQYRQGLVKATSCSCP